MTGGDEPESNAASTEPMERDRRPADCVYIAGSGRNGSTFLGLHLERSPDICFAGELTHLWERGLQENQRCGCGLPFRKCEFWTAVVLEGFGQLSSGDVSEMVSLRKRISSLTRLVQLRVGTKHVDTETVNAYGRIYTQLVAAVRKISGCQTVVDSSKYPTDLATLLCADVSLRTIHLVRDCRAVVYSWRRKKERKEIHWKTQLMPRYGAFQTALAWKQFNAVICQLAGADEERYRLLRYEDLMSDFAAELSKITNWLQCGTAELITSAKATGHSVSGNPCRFDFDPGNVKPDLEWQQQMSACDRLIAQLICRRQQREYGY